MRSSASIRRRCSRILNNPALQFYLGKLYYRLEMVDEAFDILSTVEGPQDQLVDYHKIMANLFLRKQHMEQAVVELKKALQFKKRVVVPYVCTACQQDTTEWSGRCRRCGNWNTFVALPWLKAARAAGRDSAPAGGAPFPIKALLLHLKPCRFSRGLHAGRAALNAVLAHPLRMMIAVKELFDDGLCRISPQKALRDEVLSRQECRAVLNTPDDDLLEAPASRLYRVRSRYFGKTVRLQMLQNAKSGACQEDCHYCSQSAVSTAPIERYDLLPHNR